MMPENVIWIAYACSNVVGVFLLFCCWKYPRLARALFVLLFGWAAWTNATTALHTPHFYLDYANYAGPIYRDFIQRWFASHIQVMVLCIAFGQACIAAAMLAKGWIFKAGCLGGIVFLLAIAPLGMGSAFPFSLTVGAGLWLLYRRSSATWLWEKSLRVRIV